MLRAWRKGKSEGGEYREKKEKYSELYEKKKE